MDAVSQKVNHWWVEDINQVHERAFSVFKHLDESQQHHRVLNLHHLRMYSNRLAASLSGREYAMQTFGDRLETEQEVLSFAADVLIDIYAAESAVTRASQAITAGHTQAPLHEAAARVFVSEAATRVEAAAKSALAGTVEGDTLRTLLAALRRVLKPAPVNAVQLRRQLAEAVTANGKYSFA